MNTDAAQSQLSRLLGAGHLSGGVEKNGKRLLRRLGAPVRVVLMGLPGSGKSELLNFLAGNRIIPVNCKLPTLELVFGNETQTHITQPDGTIEKHHGIHLDLINASQAVFVRLEVNLPALKNICFLEVEAEGSIDDRSAAIDWAVRRADIVLWCSQSFSKTEQTLWSRLPESVKDHSFFILNHADTLTSQGIFADRLKALQSVVADEFHSLIPIATPQAIDANDKADTDLLKASGGKTLSNAISKQVELGRSANADKVLLFLNRYNHAAKQTSRAKSKPVPSMRPDKTSAKLEMTTATEICNNNAGSSENVNIIALDFLQKNTAEMANANSDAAEILNQCCEISNHLADLYSDSTSELQEGFLEAADVMTLMQLEEGDGPAADAVTLLLQLKRGLEEKIAA